MFWKCSWIFILFSQVLGVKQGAKLDDKGGYNDVVIAINPNISPDNCNVFFSNLQVSRYLNSFASFWMKNK